MGYVYMLTDKTKGLGSHQKHYKEEKTIITHEWSFLLPQRKTYHLPEGHYKWYAPSFPSRK